MRDRAYSGLFGALALTLPMVFHACGLAGPLFLPMYWPLVTLAFFVRPRAAILTAALIPWVSSFLTGMPLLYPPLVVVLSLELAIQVAALSSGRRHPVVSLFLVLPLGRFLHAGLVWLLAQAFPNLPAAGVVLFSFAAGWPGVLLMLAFIPVFVQAAMRKDGVCEVRFLKALRRLRLPEGVVLACAQTLRWFEALSRDAEMLARALELRRAAGNERIVSEGDGPVVACHGLTVTYPGASEPVLRLNAFEVASGERIALLGANGAGKTTILQVLAGFAPFAGDVQVFGHVPRGRGLVAVRARLGVLFENPDDQFLFPTLREDVGYALARRGVPPAEMSARIDALLTAVGLGTDNRPLASLSRGQRQRAALAGLLAADPALLLLDEPTSSLDDAERDRLVGVLSAHAATMLIATHDRAFAARVATRVVELL